jgi:predicted DsbA family dithiol-disulfide isomerase
VSYEIHPDTPKEGVKLEDLFGPGYRERQRGIAARCRELGLAFQGPEVLSNSRLAVEAAEFAREAGKHPSFHRAVLAAYFGRGLDIGDPTVLGQTADEVGLDGGALADALDSGGYAGTRLAAQEEAVKLGITAVPTFIFEDGPRVVGAQQLDYFRRLLETMPAERNGQPRPGDWGRG